MYRARVYFNRFGFCFACIEWWREFVCAHKHYLSVYRFSFNAFSVVSCLRFLFRLFFFFSCHCLLRYRNIGNKIFSTVACLEWPFCSNAFYATETLHFELIKTIYFWLQFNQSACASNNFIKFNKRNCQTKEKVKKNEKLKMKNKRESSDVTQMPFNNDNGVEKK